MKIEGFFYKGFGGYGFAQLDDSAQVSVELHKKEVIFNDIFFN